MFQFIILKNKSRSMIGAFSHYCSLVKSHMIFSEQVDVLLLLEA